MILKHKVSIFIDKNDFWFLTLPLNVMVFSAFALTILTGEGLANLYKYIFWLLILIMFICYLFVFISCWARLVESDRALDAVSKNKGDL